MNARLEHPFYQNAVEAYLHGTPKTFLKLRKYRRLSVPEQALLECRARLRDRSWSKAWDSLKRVDQSAGTFLFAEKHFLSATLCFFKGDFETAAFLNLKAFELYRTANDRRGQFLSAHNIMVDFSRMGNQVLAKYYFNEAKRLSDGPGEKSLLFRARACELSQKRQYEEATVWIRRAIKLKKFLSTQDQQTLQVVAINILTRAQKFEEALQVIDQELTSGRNWELARFNFERAALLSVRDHIPIGIPPEAVSAAPEYDLKWRILLTLQGGELELAKSLWQDLRALFPSKFGQNFECLGEAEQDTSFAVILDRLTKSKTEIASDSPPVLRALLPNKLRKLRQELEMAGSPIRKEELIEKVWDVTYSPAWDGRFYKLIERAKKHGISIISSNRAYALLSPSR